ncbi:hypothetical protein EON67_10875 [archaeon]|nr:MAG: hypothetical protein EON67_10875 [archaeon]
MTARRATDVHKPATSELTLLLFSQSVVTEGMAGKPLSDSNSFLSRISVCTDLKYCRLPGALQVPATMGARMRAHTPPMTSSARIIGTHACVLT